MPRNRHEVSTETVFDHTGRLSFRERADAAPTAGRSRAPKLLQPDDAHVALDLDAGSEGFDRR